MLSKPDTLLELTDYHFKLTKQKDNYKEMYNSLNSKAQIYYLKGEKDNSMIVLDQSAALSIEVDNTDNLGEIYGNMASIYIVQRKYQEGIL